MVTKRAELQIRDADNHRPRHADRAEDRTRLGGVAWEGDVSQIESYSKADLVRRLLQQAEQHVEIHKLFADREFDAMEVRDVIDRHDITYLVPKEVYAAEIEQIEKIEAHPLADVAVERAVNPP